MCYSDFPLIQPLLREGIGTIVMALAPSPQPLSREGRGAYVVALLPSPLAGEGRGRGGRLQICHQFFDRQRPTE
jgi:hypothetical protein